MKRALERLQTADIAAALPLTRRHAENELERIADSGHALRLSETLYAPAG